MIFAVVSSSTCQCNGNTGTDSSQAASPFNEWYNTGPQCCPGWNGTQCDICQSVEVCPAIDGGNGTMLEAVGCSNNLMAPATIAEAEAGKKFSCSCGGGGDSTSAYACPMQGTYATVHAQGRHAKSKPNGRAPHRRSLNVQVAYDENGKAYNSDSGPVVTRFDWIVKVVGTCGGWGCTGL